MSATVARGRALALGCRAFGTAGCLGLALLVACERRAEAERVAPACPAVPRCVPSVSTLAPIMRTGRTVVVMPAPREVAAHDPGAAAARAAAVLSRVDWSAP